VIEPKSKLEYCRATWLQKRLAIWARDYSSGPTNRGPASRTRVPPRRGS